MATFADLEFVNDPEPDLGERAKVFFQNGYGASVIRGPYTYGGRDGLFELAVLVGNESGFRLNCETPITQDVEGHLTEEAVTDLLARIEALPSAPKPA